jgi:GTP-binding protein EngB required for normal cell division
MDSREEKIARYRRRLAVLLTKGDKLNATEQKYVEHLENQIIAFADDSQ